MLLLVVAGTTIMVQTDLSSPWPVLVHRPSAIARDQRHTQMPGPLTSLAGRRVQIDPRAQNLGTHTSVYISGQDALSTAGAQLLL